MTSRTLCYLDSNACNSNLLIREGSLRVTTRNNALNDANRTVHGALAVADGIFRFESYHWSTSRTSWADLLSIGVSQVSGALSAALDSAGGLGFGLRPGNGTVVSNGANLAAVGAFDERIPIGIYLYLSALVCTCTWLVDGTAIYTAALPTGKIWVPAASLGAAQAGDRSVSFNFGQDRFDRFTGNDGWFRATSGLDTITVSLASEGFLSAPTDTPANKTFSPAIIDAKNLFQKRAPLPWMYRSAGASAASNSSFSTVTLLNKNGALNSLRDADVRDSTFVLQKMDAPQFGTGTLTAAANQCVAIIDAITAPSRSTLQITLRGTLSRFDKPCPVRRIPWFYDDAVAGKAMPIGLGARRNLQPIPLDEEQNLFLIGDAPQTNVPLVADGGKPLDQLATPPQWTSALNGCGFKTQTKPIFRLSADASTYGGQYMPGVVDVLNGDGSFTTWAGGVPHGWALPTSPPSVVANGSISQDTTGGGSALKITSRVPYNPGAIVGGYYGYPVPLATAILQPGRTYRITLKIKQSTGATVGGTYGFAMLTSLVDDSRYWITPFHDFLTWTSGGGLNTYTYQYTVPSTLTAPLPIYLCLASAIDDLAGAPTSNIASISLDDVVVELLGQFTSAPLVGMTLTQAFTEILVVRCDEPAGIFSLADTQAIDAATGILIGLEYDEQPNVLKMLQDAADAYGAVVFEDENGVIRVRRFIDPRYGTPVAKFDRSRINGDEKATLVLADNAIGLTTSLGCRPNQVPFSGAGDFKTTSDFVTDEAVSLSQREAWSAEAQIEFESNVWPAQEYAFANGAKRFVLPIDDPEMAIPEGNRVLRMFAPDAPGLPTPPGQIGSQLSGTTAGKGKLIQFEANYNNDGTVGGELTIAPQRLYPCDVIIFHEPSLGFINTPVAVLSTSNFFVDGRLIVTGRYQ
jgi:hypothetical protein